MVKLYRVSKTEGMLYAQVFHRFTRESRLKSAKARGILGSHS